IFPMLESAWRSLGLFDDREIDRYPQRYDRRQGRFTWQFREPVGWTLTQDEQARRASGYYLYTLPDADNDEFPFPDWARMVEEARRTCAQAVDPEWLRWNRGTVAALARHAFESRDLDAMAPLADALTEAGCSQPTLLAACRPPFEPARACWVVELLL